MIPIEKYPHNLPTKPVRTVGRGNGRWVEDWVEVVNETG